MEEAELVGGGREVEVAELVGGGREEEVIWVESFWMAAKMASFCFLKKI